MKKYVMTVMAAMVLAWGSGCGGSAGDVYESEVTTQEGGTEISNPDMSDGKRDGVLVFENPAMISGELLAQCQEYAALAESYMESASLETANNERVRELTEMLCGHYEVAGRTDGNGREYYLAARRLDAPEYDDFSSLSIGYVVTPDLPEEICQIGYDDENGNEKVLYQLAEYQTEFFGDMERAEVLEQLCFIPFDASRDRAFLDAFGESGRMELDFLQKHPGLCFAKEGQSYISCYYQDEDTIKLVSEPYVCNILLTGDEQERIGTLLGQGKGRESKVFDNEEQAVSWLQKQHPLIRTTGAALILGSRHYRLLGSRECGGYLIVYGPQSVAVEYQETVYSYVMDRIKEVMGRDYTTFSDTWFDRPLAKASLEFPRLQEGDDGALAFCTVSQTVTEPEKLKQLGLLLGKAIKGHEAISGCPYRGVLNLVREDGETLQMFVAADSCDSITYEGRIGFEYGSQEDMAEIFDEAMK